MTPGWQPHPVGDHSSELEDVAAVLDPILVPLGFAPGQIGASAQQGQVSFCRGARDSTDEGCVDLVVAKGIRPRCPA